MSKNLKIVFYGTPEFATGILKTLHSSSHEVVGVVTAPDKPAGRGRQLHQSDVKKYALENDLHLLQPTNLKSAEFTDELKTLKADLQVVVAFRMLPEVVWSMPSLGTFNLHASLLPQYRGAAPINWAIINKEEQTGVTTFFIDDKIDTGAIIDQMAIPIDERENVGSLYVKLMELGANLSLKTVNDIANGNVTTRIQKDAANLKDAPKLNAGNTVIDFSKSATAVDAMVRGLNPFPVAKAMLNDGEDLIIKIYQTEIVDKTHSMEPGSIVIDDGKFLVACGENMLELVELQFPNKKRMKSADLLNGYQFTADARFGKG
ncbi:methionyl-tRNA formyltransferase [Nonlabens sp. Hel1_33_55]|uniref:methionyl-tRNA formyltransferase n=1 Tax=Nonlabens sp. Hel1_33_55 TaxID=1336802 RepID=UPI000875BA52|nr:methionyl-tRNA formyltransferase [Nonlabens sp. Hel1_33_55]SCY01133.1 methionyl-tRNA formyltransferase [Nonlabens sp. Hel1_33_55]